MKISQLQPISKVRRDLTIPLSVQGENASVTMGQILDSIASDIIPFAEVRGFTPNVQYSDGSSSMTMGTVIFDTMSNAFCRAISISSNVAGQELTTWTYFKNWDTYERFHIGDEIRQDCLFRAQNGRLYFFDGETLKSAGLTDEQADNLRHATLIEVESEEEMERRIEAGEIEPGQLYYTVEED